MERNNAETIILCDECAENIDWKFIDFPCFCLTRKLWKNVGETENSDL